MKRNILIVDDEEFICENLKYLLEGLGDEVFTALNGAEAFDIIERETIICVISDINMPVMDGIELIKKVRESGNNIPFVFFTAHGNNELMMETVKYGAFDFIDKPNFDGLEDIVKRGLKQGFNQLQNEVEQEKSTDVVVNEYQELLKLRGM